MEFGDFDIFAAKDEVAKQARVLLLDPDQVYPDPENVRRAINNVEISALASTIRDRGQLQPITVATADEDGRHRIHFGERRWRACRELGIPVRAIVSEQRDANQVRIDQFVENDQRAQLSPSDIIAFVVNQIQLGTSIADVARVIGRDRGLLQRYHALALAPDFIAERLDDISSRGALALMRAAAKDEAATRSFVAAAPLESLTVLDCERFSRAMNATSVEATTDNRPVKTAQTRASHRGDDSGMGSKTSSIAANSLRQLPNVTELEPYIDIDGRRARIISAVVQFDDEQNEQTVHFKR